MKTFREYSQLDEDTKAALAYATKAHAGQTRSDKTPYIAHPVRVAKNIELYKKSHNIDALISAAYLHDTIEDTDLTKEMISKIFNESIANNVEDLTRIKFDKKISAGETLNLLFSQHIFLNYYLVSNSNHK